MRPAGIHADIASDGTGQLTRGIRRVEKAKLFDGMGHFDIGDARLNTDGAVGGVDIEDLVHARDP